MKMARLVKLRKNFIVEVGEREVVEKCRLRRRVSWVEVERMVLVFYTSKTAHKYSEYHKNVLDRALVLSLSSDHLGSVLVRTM